WDADAEHVWITIPGPMTDDPSVIKDDGSGMRRAEVRSDYLKIANPRLTRRGERTPKFDRRIKGRKGIGKFAGLAAADHMELDTRAGGVRTRVEILRDTLLYSKLDL